MRTKSGKLQSMAVTNTNLKQSLNDSIWLDEDSLITFPGKVLVQEVCPLLGAKGLILYLMSQANINVPKTVVVPYTITSKSTDWLELAKKILNQYFPLSQILIIRSSADVEDGFHASFAGQFLSLKCDTDILNIAQTLEQVYNSAYSLKVKEYSQHQKIKEINLSLLIQEFIPAHFSGVAFSSHPIKPRDYKVYVEWTHGQLSSLVDGEVTPESFSITDNSNKYYLPSVKQDIPIENILKSNLNKIERLLGSQVDMEWLVDQNGTFWVLQARPITHKPNSKISYLVGDNIGENYPEAVVPFLYSLAKNSYYHYFRSLGKSYGFSRAVIEENDHIFRALLAVKNGRLSYNLFAVNSLLLHAPFGATLCKQFRKFIGGEEGALFIIETVSDKFQQGVKSQIVNVFLFLKMVICFLRQFLTLRNGIKRFEFWVDQSTRNCNRAINFQNLNMLYQAYSEIINIRYFKWSFPAFADSICMIFGSLLSQSEIQNIQVAPSRVGQELNKLINLIKSDPKTLTFFRMETPEKIKLELKSVNSQICNQFENYCEDWGFRRPGELLLVKPDYQENPLPLIEIIQLRLQQGDFSQTNSVQKDKNKKSVYFEAIGRIYSFGVNKRESARLCQAKLYNNLRKILLATGRLLKEQLYIESVEDIFFLNADEVEGGLVWYFLGVERIKKSS